MTSASEKNNSPKILLPEKEATYDTSGPIRWIVLGASILMAAAFGATYSWSVYVKALRVALELPQWKVQLPYTTFFIAFPLTTIFTGAIMRRLGPKVCAMLGGVCFGMGWMCAGFGSYHYFWTILGIGVLGGIGVGLAYVVPIQTCILWFPKCKGLIAGVAVVGFGGGTALISKVSGYMLEHQYTPFEIFRILGVIFFICTVFSGILMIRPAASMAAVRIKTPSLFSLLADQNFRILYFCMFLGLSAGFIIIPNLKELIPSTAFSDIKYMEAVGVHAVMLLAIANACGRLSWGFLGDYMKIGNVVRLSLLAQAITFFLACVLFSTTWLSSFISPAIGLYIIASLVGFNYAANLVLYPLASTRCWGAEKMGGIYGCMFSSNIPASVTPMIAAWVFDSTKVFTPVLIVVGAILLLVMLFVRPPNV